MLVAHLRFGLHYDLFLIGIFEGFWSADGVFTLGTYWSTAAQPCNVTAHNCQRYGEIEFLERQNLDNELFIKTVSAISSALCPVTMWSTFNIAAPRSRACLRNTPQKVQLFFLPICETMASIVHPYNSSYDKIFSGMSYCCWFRLTVWISSH